MKVNVRELEKIASILFSKLRETVGDDIDLRNDYYWDVSIDQLYNPYVTPVEITLGQLSDDLMEIHRLHNADDAISYDLKRLAAIICALSVENRTAF